jgi:hypothetical protein
VQLQEIKKPRQLFAAILQRELEARDLHPADVLRPKWDKPIQDAVRIAMQASPVLFDAPSVAKWMGINHYFLSRKLNAKV